jgi:hypothetical protein
MVQPTIDLKQLLLLRKHLCGESIYTLTPPHVEREAQMGVQNAWSGGDRDLKGFFSKFDYYM